MQAQVRTTVQRPERRGHLPPHLALNLFICIVVFCFLIWREKLGLESRLFCPLLCDRGVKENGRNTYQLFWNCRLLACQDLNRKMERRKGKRKREISQLLNLTGFVESGRRRATKYFQFWYVLHN